MPKVTSGNGRTAPPREITQTLLLEAYLEIRPGVDVARATVGQGEGERSHLVSTIRTFIAIAAASLAVASLIHRGFLIGGFEDGSAATAEGIIATVMAIGLLITLFAGRWALTVGRGALIFGLAGVSVGLFVTIIGIGPQTTPDLIYHLVLFLFLVVAVVISWRVAAETPTG